MKKYIIVSIIVAALFVGGSIMVAKAAALNKQPLNYSVKSTPVTLSRATLSDYIVRVLLGEKLITNRNATIKAIEGVLSAATLQTPNNTGGMAYDQLLLSTVRNTEGTIIRQWCCDYTVDPDSGFAGDCGETYLCYGSL